MNKYEIQVQIDGEWHTLDYGGEDIAMNYQVNNLAELSDRNSSYSQSITLPLSPRNIGIIGNYLRMDADSNMPYKYLLCDICCNGVPIVPAGAVMRIVSTNVTTFEAQVLGPIAKDISALNDIDMVAPAGSGFQRMCNIDNIVDNADIEGVNIRYAKIHPIANKTDVPQESLTALAETFYPALSFTDLFKYAFGRIGKEVVFPEGITDWATEQYILCSQATPVKDYVLKGMGKWSGQTRPGQESQQQLILTDVYAQGLVVNVLDDFRMFAPYTGDYTITADLWGNAPVGSIMQVEMTVKVGSSATGVTADDPGVVLEFKEQFDEHTLTPKKVSGVVNMTKGQWLHIDVNAFIVEEHQTSTRSDFEVTLAVNAKQANGIEDGFYLGVMYDLLASTGFSTLGDMVKEYLASYGYTIIDVTDTSVILAHHAQLVQSSRLASPADWTRKVVDLVPEISFEVGSYAKKNILTMAQNESLGDYQDKSLFLIDNDSLEAEKTVLSSAFISVTQLRDVANVPFFVMNDETPSEPEYKGVDTPVLLEIPKSYLPGSYYFTQGYNYTKYVTLQSAKAAGTIKFLDAYKALAEHILARAKTITCKARLDLTDVISLDYFLPVYIEPYGGLFQVTKISNYIPGKIVTVELVKIDI